jgi:hypothetical protein
MHNHVLAPGFLQLSPWKPCFFTEKSLNLVLAIFFPSFIRFKRYWCPRDCLLKPVSFSTLFWPYLVCFSSVSTFQVALGSYQLKLRVQTNVEHVLCFIIYLNVKYD